MQQIYHFSGMRWIHGGVFVNDDVLMVYTGEQKLYFLSVSKRQNLWAISRPRELAVSGDMRCCHIPGTEKVACIAQGKASMEEHFLLIIDWSSRELSLQRIPDCYRVIQNIVWTKQFGLTFLSYQAKGDDISLAYRIFRLTETGSLHLLYDGESPQISQAYSGNYLFMAECGGQEPQMYVYTLMQSTEGDQLELGEPKQLSIPTFLVTSPIGGARRVLPNIKWVDEKASLLTICQPMAWIGIYHFQNQKLLVETENSRVVYGKILDNQFLIGCTSGFSIESLQQI